MGELHESWMLPSDPTAAGLARRRVTALCHEQAPDAVYSLELLVSELVANAVQHGVGPVRLCLDWVDGRVRIEVQDEADAIPRQRETEAMAERGRGLMIVAALSDAWGVRAAGSGKSVWCELDTRN